MAVRRTVDRFGQVDCLVNVAGFTDRGSLVDTTPELLRPAHRGQPQGAVLPDAGRGDRPAPTSGAGLDRQRDQHVVARGSALPRALRRGEGRRSPVSPATRPTPTAGTGSGSTASTSAGPGRRRRTPIQRRFHDADDDWAERAAATQPMGRLGDPDEIADAVVFLLSDRSGVVAWAVGIVVRGSRMTQRVDHRPARDVATGTGADRRSTWRATDPARRWRWRGRHAGLLPIMGGAGMAIMMMANNNPIMMIAGLAMVGATVSVVSPRTSSSAPAAHGGSRGNVSRYLEYIDRVRDEISADAVDPAVRRPAPPPRPQPCCRTCSAIRTGGGSGASPTPTFSGAAGG